jgi:RHS repeat-associated protein
LVFVYDALGQKLQKIERVENCTGSGIGQTCNGFQYENTTNYVGGAEYKENTLVRLPHSEGAIVQEPTGVYNNHFVLRDHLGNTRVTFADRNKDGIVTDWDLVQANHFYPFGLNMEGNWNGAAGPNKYQYNGKEWNDDFGLGWNDYGARFYDPAVGRWNTVDPLAEYAQDYTPYRYGFNNPILYTDPTGMFESKSEAKKYAKDNGIKTGWFRDNQVVKQKDGSYAIENRKASTSVSNDKEFGVKTSALIVERGIHLADIGMDGLNALAQRNPEAVIKNNEATDKLYFLGSWLSFASPTAKLATVSKVVVEESKLLIQFGKVENQVFHAFRHTDKLGLDKGVVASAVESHLKSVVTQVVEGKPFNQIINVQGKNIQYTAYKLADGSFNIGRIHGID